MLLERFRILFLVCPVREICAQLEMSAISAFYVRQYIVVYASDSICGEHLDDHVPLARFCAHSKIDELTRFNFSNIDVRFHLNWLIRIQLVDVDVTTRLLEFLFELLAYRDDVAVLDKLLGELVEELLLCHRVEAVKVAELLEARVLPELVVVGLITEIDRLERNTVRVLGLEIVREVAIQDIRQHRLHEKEQS